MRNRYGFDTQYFNFILYLPNPSRLSGKTFKNSPLNVIAGNYVANVLTSVITGKQTPAMTVKMTNSISQGISRELYSKLPAGITKNIKLASGVTVLSSAEPVKVYEDFATLDLISGGRAEIFVGRGSFIESFPLYGYSLDNYEILFEEKLDLLLKINSKETS